MSESVGAAAKAIVGGGIDEGRVVNGKRRVTRKAERSREEYNGMVGIRNVYLVFVKGLTSCECFLDSRSVRGTKPADHSRQLSDDDHKFPRTGNSGKRACARIPNALCTGKS